MRSEAVAGAWKTFACRSSGAPGAAGRSRLAAARPPGTKMSGQRSLPEWKVRRAA